MNGLAEEKTDVKTERGGTPAKKISNIEKLARFISKKNSPYQLTDAYMLLTKVEINNTNQCFGKSQIAIGNVSAGFNKPTSNKKIS